MDEGKKIPSVEDDLKPLFNRLSGMPIAQAIAELEKAADQIDQQEKIYKISLLDRQEQRKALQEWPNEQKPDLTARGTPRKRRLHKDDKTKSVVTNRNFVQLGGRIPVELKDKFLQFVNDEGLVQGEAMTQAIEHYLENRILK